MHSKHLGDALDHWKGSIIQRLESRRLLQDIAVIPMFTDDCWDSQKVAAYSHLLNLKSDKVLQTGRKFGGGKHDREKYFEAISHAGDLFLDPDTGVSISPSTKNDSEHITISEIKELLGNDRVILVYQHRGRYKSTEWIKDIIDEVRREIKKLNSTTYECGNVAMLFFSYNRDRMEKINNYLKEEMLSDVHMDKDRVIMW